MPYKKRRSRSRAATNTKIRYKRPTAKTQQSQILDINTKLNTVQRQIRGIRYKVQHTYHSGGIIQATAAQPFTAYALNNPSQMGQIFSAPGEAAGGKYNFDSAGRFYLNYNITSGKEPSPMNLTVFIIRPKTAKVAVSAGINVPIAPNAPPLTLLNNTDFTQTLGICMINTKRWHIDYHAAVNTSPIITSINQPGAPTPAPLQNWQGDLHPIRKHYKGRNVLKLNNRTGIWSDTQDHAVNASQRQFLVIFNNNLNTQLSPNIAFQCLWTAYTSE